MAFLEVSAKTAANIDTAFTDSAKTIHERVQQGADFGAAK